MIDWVVNTYHSFMVFAEANPVVAGAVSLWGLTVLSYLARGVPMAIYNFFRRNLVTSMTMNNTSYEKNIMLVDFLGWFEDNKFTSWSRTFMVNPKTRYYGYAEKNQLSAGYGLHFFWYKRRLFWMKIGKLDSSGSEKQKEEVTIYTLGRSNKRFREMVEEFTPDLKDTKFIYTWSTSDGWVESKELVPKPLASVALTPEVNSFVKKDIPEFIGMKDWYYEKGLAYKLTAILEGPPGTGKTSILRAIATEYNKHICTLNINSVSDTSLALALNSAPKGSVIAIEDFEGSIATKTRKIEPEEKDDTFSFLSLSGILNALDGVSTLDDVLVFLTTNHLSKVDPAVYRKGRVDKILHVGPIDPLTAQKYAESLFPGSSFDNVFSGPILGCQLHNALMMSKNNQSLYRATIKSIYLNDNNLKGV